ncbi:MAG: class I SAM-dependent methyltransferase [Woeseiaceae bacterium]
MNRREFVAALGALLATPLNSRVLAADTVELSKGLGNFRYIYSNPRLKEEFLNFLINVFHLYPEQELHTTMARLATSLETDRQVYDALQEEMGDLSPFLGALRYAIPALRKQKRIMASQTLMLIDPDATYEGHLEIGSTGRYIGILEDELNITGDVFLLHTKSAGYGPEDIAERGQLAKIGTHIDMGNYSTQFANIIPHNSLDMVTVFIGFHHCPLETRESFVSSVRDVLRPGGTLILRDHNCHDEDSWRMAALAHDAFNAGTDETWQFNADELRNFYSMRFIIDYVEGIGFRNNKQLLYQPGDPTRNGLTAFVKI